MSIEVYDKTKNIDLESEVINAFKQMENVADQTNRYDTSEEADIITIEKYAGTGQFTVVGKEFHDLILQVQHINQPLVDLTLGPVIDIWNKARESSKLPSSLEVTKALEFTGMDKIKLNSTKSEIYLAQEGMSLDLGAVAKGYAVELAWQSLKDQQDDIYGIINAGGNIKTIGEKPDGTAWQIAMTDPLDLNNNLGIMHLAADEVVATSGDYQRYFEVKGVKYHHLLDPKTGFPAMHNHSVIILTTNGFIADYYSTLLFLLPANEGLKIAESTPDIEAVIVTQDQKIYTTSGLDQRIEWTLQGGYQLVTP